jgi:hypothetical protein
LKAHSSGTAILDFVEIDWVEYRFDEGHAHKSEERGWPKQLSTQCLGIEPGVERASNPPKPTHTDFAEVRCAESVEPSWRYQTDVCSKRPEENQELQLLSRPAQKENGEV